MLLGPPLFISLVFCFGLIILQSNNARHTDLSNAHKPVAIKSQTHIATPAFAKDAALSTAAPTTTDSSINDAAPTVTAGNPVTATPQPSASLPRTSLQATVHSGNTQLTNTSTTTSISSKSDSTPQKQSALKLLPLNLPKLLY